MSELSKNENLDFSKLDNMSSEELWSIVDDIFYSQSYEESNAEIVLYIMEVLKKRGELLKPKKDISTIWRDAESDTVTELPRRRIGRKVLRFAVSLAAAIALLMALAVTASAMGYDVFGAIATWTDETFRFKSAGSPSQAIVQNTKAIPDELTEFAELLDENGLDSQSLLPGYLPEGYEIIEMSTSDMVHYIEYFCALQNGSKNIKISIDTYFDDTYTTVHEKDADDPNEYALNGVTHYIMSNYGKYFAVWTNGNLKYSLSGFSAEDELIATINSIYGEEK